ncbi:hypothetical protein BT93_B2161 [Corymbia citriodora subsp. variegata]|nr:hypothetical protein BT93_B2161 [Corymbia citriodora subsp. variegata]
MIRISFSPKEIITGEPSSLEILSFTPQDSSKKIPRSKRLSVYQIPRCRKIVQQNRNCSCWVCGRLRICGV